MCFYVSKLSPDNVTRYDGDKEINKLRRKHNVFYPKFGTLFCDIVASKRKVKPCAKYSCDLLFK